MSRRRFLLVRLGAMGDILHTLPAAATIRRSFPASHITWAVEAKWAPLLDGNGLVDELAVFERKDVPSLLRLRRLMKASHYHVAVDFQGLIKSAFVARLAGPDQIAGWHRSVAREPLASLLYSQKVIPRSAHVVDRNLELAGCVGADLVDLRFPLPPGRPEGVLPEIPFVLANPVAGWGSKQWPLEHYSEIGRRLSLRGMELVLNGAEPVHAPFTLPHQSGLPGLINATRRAVAVIGVDSGPLHLAAALGIPGVAVFGPTDPARNGPYGGTFRVLRATGARTTYKRGAAIDDSMRSITPDRVWAELERLLPPR